MKVFTLRCSSCGASLQIDSDMDRFACGYCGAEQLVELKGGTVSLKIVSDAIRQVQAGTDKTAAELALKRMTEEREALTRSYQQKRVAAEKAKSNAKAGVAAGVFVLAAVICCSSAKVLSGGGMVIVLALAGVVCYFAIRSQTRPIDEALAQDSARIRRQISELDERIAVKRTIADGD